MSLSKTELKLNDIIQYLNKRFNQDTSEYSFIQGAKPQVIRYDKETAISTWACGAIVCIEDIIYFFSEDDGTWYCDDKGSQTNFSIGWADSFINAFNSLSDYVKENGEPVRYNLGTDSEGNTIYGDICHYKLK